ncbi:MAG: LuxR C-terminal-related transcriptional regulator [Burkholderiales bacterium]|jgi:DNA-binding CsgD family transcriptional regulator
MTAMHTAVCDSMRLPTPAVIRRPPVPVAQPAAPTGLTSTAQRALVDAMENPALLIEEDGWVRAANPAAVALLAPGGRLVMRSGRLEPTEARLAGAWARLLATALQSSRAEATLNDSAGPLTVRAVHVGAGRLLVSLSAACLGQRSPADPVERLTRETGLSCSERAVLRHLLDGATVREVARARETSESTVRTQIRSLLFKTNTSSIRQLVLLALNPDAGLALRADAAAAPTVA